MFCTVIFSLLFFYFAGGDALLSKPCVPTEKTEGPCHLCVCGLDGFFRCQRRPHCIEDKSANVSSSGLPEIVEGEVCEEGKLYRKQCNICRCTLHRALKCTTKLCVKDPNMNIELLSAPAKPKLDLPDLPSGPCVVGKFYKKGCRKCYCEYNQKPVCAAGPVGPKCKLQIKSYREAIPDDYGVKTKNMDITKLPSLPNLSTKCDPGLTYKVDCNICICLANKNLLCTSKLCLSIDDMNRLEAKRRTGLPCGGKDKISDDTCMKCRCIDEKVTCEALKHCEVPARRAALHGEATEDQPHFPKTMDPTQKCVPHSIYKMNCNRCYCQDDGALRCTSMTCLNYVQARSLQALVD